MLEPDARHLLLDALRPPLGHTLDLAVGTTYTLDLLALMTAPVAFAMFNRQGGDGSLIEDPIATLQALREYASRITVFCQAGQISVPPEFRSLLVYLEGSVHPVVPPDPGAIFHPKVWYIRFRHAEGEGIAYRLLCLSRNLTFDRSWDTVLRLEGRAGDEPSRPELARFANSLIAMAERTHPLTRERTEAIRALGREFSCAIWTLPDGFNEMRFWPLGDDDVHRWPFEGRRDRMLVVSPFVTQGTLNRLTKGHRGSILVSRPGSLDKLGQQATKHLAERLVLSSDASSPTDDQAGEDRTEAIAESADHRLEGLHAKTYVADAGWRARVWTGSANATDAAFHGNVEFVVELGGSKERCGVHATIGDQADRLGLRKLVIPYEPSQVQPVGPTEAECIEQHLDQARRALGGLRFTATCATIGPDRWRLTLEGVRTVTTVTPATLQGITATIRPVTLGAGSAMAPALDASGLHASFDVSEPAVTPYFAISLTMGDAEVAFLVAAELIDPPPGRAERVLSSLLSNRADLIRFLLLLLGNVEDALAGVDGGTGGGMEQGAWLAALASEALLEPLVRAFSRDPQRLRDIERVMAEIRRSPEGESILPDRWNEIWDPLAAALVPETTR
ncbi:MAG: phospholipase D family protein [Chloroflexota bacterium]|nr:phospholipase D family protein [Chloroflexota bacterium]